MKKPNRRLKVMHIISGDLWAGAEVQGYTLLKHLKPDVDLRVIVLNDGTLARQLKAIGIEVCLVPEERLTSVQILFTIRSLIRQFSPDLIHTHRQKENILGCFANLLAGHLAFPFCPSLRTAHGAPEHAPRGKQRLQVWLDNWVGRFLQRAVIAVSSELAEKLAKVFPPTKIFTIHNGVDIARLKGHVANFRMESPEALHVGIVGRLEPVKRVDLFLGMAELLSQMSKDRQWRFHIIGTGRLAAQLHAQAQGLGVREQVYFHGHRDDVASCLQSLDCLVMCSDHEGTPMVALEAMAMSVPVVAHKTGGLIELLARYPELLVEQHSAEGYARAVLKLLGLSSPLEIKLDNKFLAEVNVEATLQLYQRLVEA